MGDIAFRLRCLYRDSATGSGDLYLKAADEIERFQKERDDINEKHVRAAQRHVEEVERLRAENQAMKETIEDLAPKLTAAEARIEELEREKNSYYEIEIDEEGQPTNLHIITTAQIDEAAERISHWTDSATDAGWALLAMLFGIKRCPNNSCVDGREPVECADGEVDLDKCPYCNGHGWTKEVP